MDYSHPIDEIIVASNPEKYAGMTPEQVEKAVRSIPLDDMPRLIRESFVQVRGDYVRKGRKVAFNMIGVVRDMLSRLETIDATRLDDIEQRTFDAFERQSQATTLDELYDSAANVAKVMDELRPTVDEVEKVLLDIQAKQK